MTSRARAGSGSILPASSSSAAAFTSASGSTPIVAHEVQYAAEYGIGSEHCLTIAASALPHTSHGIPRPGISITFCACRRVRGRARSKCGVRMSCPGWASQERSERLLECGACSLRVLGTVEKVAVAAQRDV